MGYKRADSILPEELIKLIQQYVDGESIYIPRKDDNRAEWGSNTNTRQELNHRNNLIISDYQNGMDMAELSEKYFLSVKSIQRIVYNYKSKLTIV